MKKFWLLSLLLISAIASANGPWYRAAQDFKFPSQVATEHYSWATPIVATTNQIKTSTGQTNATILTISSFTNQPDYARNITVTPGGTTANVGSCTVVVAGTNIYGKSISENFAITSTQSTTTTGAKAFLTVSSVTMPAACAGGTGVTWIVGVGSKLGLIRCLTNAGDYDFSEFNGVYETTRGTIANSATVVESNTFTPNGTMDGTKPVDLFYIQNYRCYPN